MLNTELPSLTSDIIFKSFMLDDDVKEYKAELIHLITNIPKEDILNNSIYINNELPINTRNNKRYRCDIILSISNNIINIEMNNIYYKGIIEKNNSYTFKILGDRYAKGEDYINLKKVYQINIDNYEIYPESKLLYKFKIVEESGKYLETENYESYHLNLEYLRKKCYNNCKLTRLEHLCKLFFITNKEEAEELAKEDDIMEKAVNKLYELSEDEKLMGLYDAEKVDQMTQNTMKLSARLEGIEEGKKVGLEEGKKVGLEEGQQKEKIEITKKLLEKKIDIETISSITSLNIKEIKKLININ